MFSWIFPRVGQFSPWTVCRRTFYPPTISSCRHFPSQFASRSADIAIVYRRAIHWPRIRGLAV